MPQPVAPALSAPANLISIAPPSKPLDSGNSSFKDALSQVTEKPRMDKPAADRAAPKNGAGAAKPAAKAPPSKPSSSPKKTSTAVASKTQKPAASPSDKAKVPDDPADGVHAADQQNGDPTNDPKGDPSSDGSDSGNGQPDANSDGSGAEAASAAKVAASQTEGTGQANPGATATTAAQAGDDSSKAATTTGSSKDSKASRKRDAADAGQLAAQAAAPPQGTATPTVAKDPANSAGDQPAVPNPALAAAPIDPSPQSDSTALAKSKTTGTAKASDDASDASSTTDSATAAIALPGFADAVDATGDSDADAPQKVQGAGISAAAKPEDILAKLGMSQTTLDGRAPARTDQAKAAEQSAPANARPEVSFAEANHPTIVAGIHGQLLPDGGSMDIHLSPPDLGAMHVHVEVRDGAVTASFQAADEQTAKLLSHSLGDLKTALEAQGVNVEKLHVSQMPKDQQSSQGNAGKGNREPDADQQHAAQQEQQRKEMVRRMWSRLMKGKDPLDLVA